MGVEIAENELGKKRMNPKAEVTNNFKLPTDLCICDDGSVTMKDTYSGNPADDTLKVVSITVDGVVYPITADKQASLDSANVAQAADMNPLEKALVSALERSEVNVYVKATYASTTLTIVHKGRRVLSVATLSDGSTLSFTRAAL